MILDILPGAQQHPLIAILHCKIKMIINYTRCQKQIN